MDLLTQSATNAQMVKLLLPVVVVLAVFIGPVGAVDLCACSCAASATDTFDWSKLLGGFVTTGGSSSCTPTVCDTKYNGSVQCTNNGFPYVLATYAPSITPDATLTLTSASCTVGGTPITTTGTDCNSQCMHSFDVGSDGNNAILLPTYSGSACTCSIGEIVSTSTSQTAGAGSGVLVTPTPTDPNVDFTWTATLNGNTGTYSMTQTGGACTLNYALVATTSSSSSSLLKPTAALLLGALYAAYL